MRAFNKGYTVAAAVLMLAACSSQQAPSAQAPGAAPATGAGAVSAAHTVDWYKANAAERKATLAACRANAGELQNTPDCVNAGNAQADVTWGAKGGITGVKPVTFGKPSQAKTNPPKKGS